MAPAIIHLAVEALSDRGLLDVFVMHSMEEGLVAKYEALGRENVDPAVIRAAISQILCETGNRALPVLASSLAKNKSDEAKKALMLASDCFEAAVAFERTQLSGYVGLAHAFKTMGNSADSHKNAQRGLSVLADIRRDPASHTIARSKIFHAKIIDMADRQLKLYVCREHTDREGGVELQER